VNGCLLTLNVLIALLWPPQRGARAHPAVVRHERDQGWATCAMTQAGFVRIVSNPAFSRRVGFSTRCAGKFWRANLSIGRTGFWADDLGVAEALAQFEGRLMVTSKSRTGILLVWRSPEGKAGDSGFRGCVFAGGSE